MKREEAVNLFREFSISCENFLPVSVSIIRSRPGDLLSVGYRLHIHAELDGETVALIAAIASRNCLAIRQKDEKEIIIYKPKATQT